MVKENTNKRKLTPEQKYELVRLAREISEIENAIKNVHPENGYKKTVMLRGVRDVAITSEEGMEVRDSYGDPAPTIHDPQFFETITGYLNERKERLIDRMEEIIDERGSGDE